MQERGIGGDQAKVVRHVLSRAAGARGRRRAVTLLLAAYQATR